MAYAPMHLCTYSTDPIFPPSHWPSYDLLPEFDGPAYDDRRQSVSHFNDHQMNERIVQHGH